MGLVPNVFSEAPLTAVMRVMVKFRNLAICLR